MTAVVLDRVTKIYDGGVLAVNEVELEVQDGELLVLLGPSGCGKTTLLRLIAGLEDATSGDLWLSGQRANDLQPQRRNVAMVFQHGALYPHLTVRQNLAFPLQTAGETDHAAIDTRVREMAHGLGIGHKLERRPGMLSGGERQRVAMGRALIRGEPTVLLMDEPLASLDVSLRNDLRSEIGALVRSLHLTTVYVTHDQAEALSLADRIAVIRDGVVEDIGTPDRVYSDPATAFVASFMGSPPTNLAWATVWLVNGERVILDFRGQRLELPWTDVRAEALTPYHGQRVIVGIRPEALIPSQATEGGSLLHGKISTLEFYGHEWLARLDVGLRLVDVSSLRGRTVVPGGGPAAQGPEHSAGRRAETGDQHDGHHGEHRGASLLIRLGSPRGWAIGQEATVAVDVSSIHIFDAQGRRIDAVPARAADPIPAS